MRQSQLRTLICVLVLCAASVGREVAAQQVSAEPATTPKVKEPDVSPNPVLPPIPLPLLFQLPYSGAQFDSLELTKQQRDDISKFMAEHQASQNPIRVIQQDFEQTRLKNHRFLVSINEYLAGIETKGRAAAQQLLTAEQQAKLRQMRRQEIDRLNEPVPPLVVGSFLEPPVGQYLCHDDLLSALILPAVQQKLQMTDKQLEQVHAVRREAYPAARELVLQAVQPLRPQTAAPDPRILARVDEWNKKSYDLLTGQQRTRLDAVMQRRKEKGLTPEELAQFARYSQQLQNSTEVVQIRYQYTDGVTTYKIPVPNLYSEPDVYAALALTADQRAAFAKVLTDAQSDVNRFQSEQQAAEGKIVSERQQRLREAVLAHNRSYQGQLSGVLTTEQSQLLAELKWRSLGLPALREPELVKLLQLTEQQQTAIAEVFNTPAPQMQAPTDPTNFAEFNQIQAAYQRRLTAHFSSQKGRVWAQLTSQQSAQLERLIGQKRQAP